MRGKLRLLDEWLGRQWEKVWPDAGEDGEYLWHRYLAYSVANFILALILVIVQILFVTGKTVTVFLSILAPTNLALFGICIQKILDGKTPNPGWRSITATSSILLATILNGVGTPLIPYEWSDLRKNSNAPDVDVFATPISGLITAPPPEPIADVMQLTPAIAALPSTATAVPPTVATRVEASQVPEATPTVVPTMQATEEPTDLVETVEESASSPVLQDSSVTPTPPDIPTDEPTQTNTPSPDASSSITPTPESSDDPDCFSFALEVAYYPEVDNPDRSKCEDDNIEATVHGKLILYMGEDGIIDGEGADLIFFEFFDRSKNPEGVYLNPTEIAVAHDIDGPYNVVFVWGNDNPADNGLFVSTYPVESSDQFISPADLIRLSDLKERSGIAIDIGPFVSDSEDKSLPYRYVRVQPYQVEDASEQLTVEVDAVQRILHISSSNFFVPDSTDIGTFDSSSQEALDSFREIILLREDDKYLRDLTAVELVSLTLPQMTIDRDRLFEVSGSDVEQLFKQHNVSGEPPYTLHVDETEEILLEVGLLWDAPSYPLTSYELESLINVYTFNLIGVGSSTLEPDDFGTLLDSYAEHNDFWVAFYENDDKRLADLETNATVLQARVAITMES